MRKTIYLPLILLLTFGFISCQKEEIQPTVPDSPESPEGFFWCQRPVKSANVNFTLGDTVRNSIMIDGESRDYLIYVPRTYNSWFTQDYDYPVVFMFHGSNQVAPRMVSHTGWTSLAETEHFIVVIPQGWNYDMRTGPRENRWATDNSIDKIASTEHLRDDVKFITQIRRALLKRMRTNCQKFYACGFSNGGSFVKTKIRIELDHYFAATGSCGGIGLETPLSPVHGRHVSHFEIVGTSDQTVFQKFYPPGPNSVPFDCNVWPGEPFWYVVQNMATSMGFPPNTYNQHFNPLPSFRHSWIVYGATGNTGLAYRLRMILNLGHKYPGPTTVKDLTSEYWNFMKDRTL